MVFSKWKEHFVFILYFNHALFILKRAWLKYNIDAAWVRLPLVYKKVDSAGRGLAKSLSRTSCASELDWGWLTNSAHDIKYAFREISSRQKVARRKGAICLQIWRLELDDRVVQWFSLFWRGRVSAVQDSVHKLEIKTQWGELHCVIQWKHVRLHVKMRLSRSPEQPSLWYNKACQQGGRDGKWRGGALY